MEEKVYTEYDFNEYRSIYFFEDCDIIKNKLNIKNYTDLMNADVDLTTLRTSDLFLHPIRGRFGTAHLKKIHKYMFQDIYYFAGEIRKENISKGNTFFCRCEFIIENLDSIFKKLQKENFLKGLNLDEFCNRCSYFMAELNLIHPFREGNGRVIREYIRLLALKAGYKIEWYKVDSNKLLVASIKSANDELDELRNILKDSIVNKDIL